jgi:electron transfer flavoprotein alpha/beta subunit
MPNHRSGIVERIAELRERAGRDVPVVVMGPPTDAQVLEAYAAAGVDRVLFWLPSARRSVVEARLDEIERTMAELTGDV